MSDLRRLLREPLVAAIIAAVTAALILFVLLPLFKVFQMSLRTEGGYGLQVYRDLLSQPFNRRPLLNGLRLKRRSPAEIAERVRAVMGMTGLTGLERRYPGHLSGGQQQRVAVARAIVGEAQVAYEVEVAGALLLAEIPNPQERGLYPRGEPVGVRLLPRSLHLLPEA